MLRSQNSIFHVTMKLVDAGLIAFAFLFASAYASFPWNPHFSVLALIAVISYYFIAFYKGLYESWRSGSILEESFNVLKCWTIVVLFLLLISFLLAMTGERFRNVLTYWMLFSLFSLVAWRVFLRLFLRFIRKKGFNKRYVIIVGAGFLGTKLVKVLEGASWTGIKVIGFFDDQKKTGDLSVQIPVLGTVDQLQDYLRYHDVDHVYITLPMHAEKKITNILHGCRTLGAQIFVVPDLFMYQLFNSRIETLGEMLLINFNPAIQWKRYFDILFSLLAIIFSFPMTLAIAVLIKLEDGGPVFYGHKRITMAGKEFKCLKFRTMFVDADKKLEEILRADPNAREEWARSFKLKNDPRLTRIGRFLRKTSLDELPQFINVLKGEMSVVGARPIVEKELFDYYKENGGLYCSMKPGITGLWQVGKRNDVDDYGERVQLDTWYVQNHSLWLDIKIIFKTVNAVFHGKGAY